MQERSLESFSKETLIEFIKDNIAWGRKNWRVELIAIEKRIELDRLFKRMGEIMAEKHKIKFTA